MVKLHQGTIDNTIHVSEMQDGQIAIIVRWNASSQIGRIVQRSGNDLIVIGLDAKWEDWSGLKDMRIAENRVRILQKGELIEIC